MARDTDPAPLNSSADGLRTLPPQDDAAGARHTDPAPDRLNMERMQDLNARLFRMSEQLKTTRMDAEENQIRSLDLEAQLREQGERRAADLEQMAALRVQVEVASKQLGQALTEFAATRRNQEQELATRTHAHQEDAARWQAELDQLRVHADEAMRLLGGVLSSHSWSLTRPLRRVADFLRRRRWLEPTVPSLAAIRLAGDHPHARLPRDADVSGTPQAQDDA